MVLTGAQAADYVTRVVALLRGARLSRAWPDARPLADHIAAMHPEVHRGLQPPLEISPHTGLPVWTAWQTVASDQAGAARVLASLAAPEVLDAQRDRSAAHRRLADRAHYLRALQGRALAPLGDLEVALRHTSATEQHAGFTVALDKLDASALFVRLGVQLTQTGAQYDSGLLAVQIDVAQATDALRSLIYRSSALDAELVWLSLATRPDMQLERVERGTVGPIWLAGFNWPDALLGPAPSESAAVASFGLQTVALDITGHRDDDLLSAPHSAAVAQERAQARAEQGYRVHHARRFVATPDAIARVHAAAEARGTRAVVRALRRRRP
jgi:hypothetical protein